MEKKGFTLVEMMIVIIILGLLAAITIPTFRASDIVVYIDKTNGKKTLVYQVDDRYNYKKLYFRDVGLDGILDSVEDSHGLISEPNIITARSAPSARSVSWSIWVDRFKQEIRPEAAGN